MSGESGGAWMATRVMDLVEGAVTLALSPVLLPAIVRSERSREMASLSASHLALAGYVRFGRSQQCILGEHFCTNEARLTFVGCIVQAPKVQATHTITPYVPVWLETWHATRAAIPPTPTIKIERPQPALLLKPNRS